MQLAVMDIEGSFHNIMFYLFRDVAYSAFAGPGSRLKLFRAGG